MIVTTPFLRASGAGFTSYLAENQVKSSQVAFNKNK